MMPQTNIRRRLTVSISLAPGISSERGETLVEYLLCSGLFILALFVSVNGIALATGKTFCAAATSMKLAGGGSISSLDNTDTGMGYDECFVLYGYVSPPSPASHPPPPDPEGQGGPEGNTQQSENLD